MKPISKTTILLIVAAAQLFVSCGNNSGVKTETAAGQKPAQQMPQPLRETVITAEQQKALTPAMVLQNLKDGNLRFANNEITARDHSKMVRAASSGQFPKSVILSCVDSRIPVEDVFDKGIGDMFVGRVAGNFVNEDILGSMEFGCKVSGAKLIVVMGHGNCGAIKSAIDDVKLGNITAMLAKIKPAIAMSAKFQGEKSSKNMTYVDAVGKNNVLNTIQTIKQRSPILKEMFDKGEINIVGAYYDMETGRVSFLE